MIVVNVDFNDLARGGRVVAMDKWSSHPLEYDRIVYATDYEGTNFICRVEDHDLLTDIFYLKMLVDVSGKSIDEVYSETAIEMWTVKEREAFTYIFGTPLEIEDYQKRLGEAQEKYYAVRAIKFHDDIQKTIRKLDNL